MKNYKLYTFKTANGSYNLSAKHNREAMKLVGRCISIFGDIVSLKDNNGKIIVKN